MTAPISGVSTANASTSDAATPEPVQVGIADLAAGAGTLTLATLGIGSCVAVVLHDAHSRVGAMAHVLLPHPALSAQVPRAGKFPATAVPEMVRRMKELGSTGEIRARLVGGASMFPGMLSGTSVSLGVRNVKACREACVANAVPIVGEAVGGDAGRSVWFEVHTGDVRVRTVRGDDVRL